MLIGTRRGVLSRNPSGAAWWEVAGKTCVAAYQPKGAASYEASLVNLAQPGTYNATEGVAPTWDAATGWGFNGSTQYLDTGIVPSSWSWTYLVRFTDGAGVGIQSLLGTTNVAGNRRIGLHHVYNAARIYYHGSNYTEPGSPLTTGVMGMAGLQPYLNGAADGGTITSSTYDMDRTLFIAARNLGSVANFGNVKIVSLAIYSDTLSAAEVATVSAAMAAL